ncbi:hypothetical protein C8F01DRAFT_1269839 [Mycena amicta]|nr:hypothetical protein C8F01DRAFT_1269839 [Mycena amicta]
MSSRPAASSSAPKTRATRRTNAVASGSGTSGSPSPVKRRRFKSGSISYSAQPTMSFPPPGAPLPVSVNNTPFFKVSSPSLFSREFSPLAAPGAAVSPAQAPPAASSSAAKLPMPAFGDKFMGLLYPGDWDNRVDISGLPDEPLRARLQQESIASAAKSADLVRRFRLRVAEGFLYPRSVHPTQDYPSSDMCLRRMLMSRMRLQDMLRDDGPFAKAEHLSTPPPELDLPTWVEPIVDFDTGYDKAVGRMPITPHAPSRDDLRGPDGPMMQDDFRNRWLAFEASMNEWRERDRVFRARCIHEQVELPRLAHDEYVALLTARFEEDTRARSSDVAAIRNSLQDVLSETRNAAIASAEYHVALQRESDCAGTREHLLQLYEELTRGLQFLVENGHSAPFGDVYVDFANTVLLQRLQSVDPSSGLKFRRFDKSEFDPWSIVYRSDFTTPGSLVYGLDPTSVPLVSDSLLRSPTRIVRPPSPLPDVPMDIDVGAPAAAQVPPRVFGHPDGLSHKVSAKKRDTSGVWNFLSDSGTDSAHEEELPPRKHSPSRKVAARRIVSSDSSGSSSDEDEKVVVIHPVVPVPVLSVRSDWHGNHIDLEPTVDLEELALPPSPLYSSWTTLVQEGPLPLARFILLLVRKAHELTFSTRPVSPVNYCLRCVAEEVPCVFAVPGAAGRPSADGRATGSKKAGPPPGGSRCARCRVKRGGCTEAKEVPDSVEYASFSGHFSNLICWLNETLHHDSEKFEEFQANIEACFDEDGFRLPPSTPAPLDIDDGMPEAVPVPDETPADVAPIPPPIPLDGDVTATPRDRIPVPTFLGLPLPERKAKGLRGTVWQSTLVPAPRLPESLPSFLGRSHPYRRTVIVEEAEPTFRWPDRSYRPPIPSDLFPLPADALAVDVRSDSVAGRYEFGDAAELFKDLEDDKLLDSFVQLVRRSQHAVTMLTRGVAYALGPRLLKVLNQRGLDVDVPRLGATLDGRPLPFPTPLSDISGDLALHAHLCRMAGDEHPFSAFIRAAFESDTMKSYATGKGVFEQSDQVEWEHFAETALFKHLIVNPRKREPPVPDPALDIPSLVLDSALSFASTFGAAFDDSASDKTVLGQGIDLSGNLDRPADLLVKLDRGKRLLPLSSPIPACFSSSIAETVSPLRQLAPGHRSKTAVVDGGNLPSGYRASGSSNPAPLPLFFPEPGLAKNVELDEDQSMEQSSGERQYDQSKDSTFGERQDDRSMVDGIAILPGASESNDGEMDVSMEVAEPEVDELNGD